MLAGVSILSADPRRKDGKSTFVIQGELRPCTLCDIHRKDVQEKLLGLMEYATVLKLTQVGETRSLRRSGELWLRNSANWPRNFGIRGAFIYEGRSEKGVATVY